MRKLALLTALFAAQHIVLGVRVVPNTHISFELLGTAGEVSGVTNGSTVTPNYTLGPATGTVVVSGTGAVQFSDDGVRFLQAGQQNTNTAYYRFLGAGLASIISCDHGDISFTIKSAYSWAERQALTSLQNRIYFDMWDDSAVNILQFSSRIFLNEPDPAEVGGPRGPPEASANRLKFSWTACGQNVEWDLDLGQEDTLFGHDVSADFRMDWNSTAGHGADQSIMHLYMNNVLRQTLSYTYIAPNLGDSVSKWLIGAQVGSGDGYFSADEYMKNIVVRRLQ